MQRSFARETRLVIPQTMSSDLRSPTLEEVRIKSKQSERLCFGFKKFAGGASKIETTMMYSTANIVDHFWAAGNMVEKLAEFCD